MDPKKKKKKVIARDKATFVKSRIHSDNIDDYKYDEKPSVLQKGNPDGNPADRALDDLLKGDVFKSSGKSIKASNSNSRRYA